MDVSKNKNKLQSKGLQLSLNGPIHSLINSYNGKTLEFLVLAWKRCDGFLLN